jgi:outer membrane protein W
VNPFSLGVNVHFNGGGRTDFYTGAFLAYVLFGDLDVDGESTSFQNDLTYGIQIGADVPFRDTRWSFSGKLRYLDATAELKSSDGGGEFLSIRPVSLQFGMAYRF